MQTLISDNFKQHDVDGWLKQKLTSGNYPGTFTATYYKYTSEGTMIRTLHYKGSDDGFETNSYPILWDIHLCPRRVAIQLIVPVETSGMPKQLNPTQMQTIIFIYK